MARHGCQICGTGDGLCSPHAARIKATVKVEGRPPSNVPFPKKGWEKP